LVFVEDGKWKKLIDELQITIGVFVLRFLVGSTYLLRKLIV